MEVRFSSFGQIKLKKKMTVDFKYELMNATIKYNLANHRTESLRMVLIGILLLYHYYLGLQKVLAFNDYRFWLQHTPIIKSWANTLVYAVPALQLFVAALIIPKKTRSIVVSVIILSQLVFIVWVIYVFYATPYLFWPWRAFWSQSNWFLKLLEALVVSWTAMLLLIADRNKK